jgi:hypothetical protein
MKQFIIAAGLLAMSASSSYATLAVWEGELFVRTASAACKPQGIDGGFFANHWHAVFKPRGIGTNGTDTKFSALNQRSAFQLTWHSRPFGNGVVDGTGIGGTANLTTWKVTFSGATMSPPVPVPTTPTVILRATIANFSGITGCTVTVVATLGLRPNLNLQP